MASKKLNGTVIVTQHFEDLINRLLRSGSPKKWFRAYFNHGLINYIFSQKRLLPCNGTEEKLVMGNLKETDWDTLWHSHGAEAVRRAVRCCDRNC